MRLLVMAILVVPALAVGEVTKFDTAITVRVDDDNQALGAAFKDQLGTKGGTRADTCWHKVGRLHAKLGLEDGKVTSVDIDQLDDKAAKACVTKVLKAIVLATARGHSTADVELDASDRAQNKKNLDNAIDKQLSANPSKFLVLKEGDVGTSHGTGTGVGTGGGTGIGTGVSTGGGTGTGRGGLVASDPSPPAKIMLGPTDPASPPTEGELTADEINRVMRARAGIFRACYQKELAKEPKLAGKVVMKLTIKSDGTVGSVVVASTTLKSAAVETCLRSQIIRLKFPAKSAAVVNYPFVFAQGG